FDRTFGPKPSKAETAQKDADAAKKVADEAQKSADAAKKVADETKKTADDAQKTADAANLKAALEKLKEGTKPSKPEQQKEPPKSKLDKFLDANPNIKTNQDLINKFYKDGGGTWKGAVAQAKKAGVTLNELVKNR